MKKHDFLRKVRFCESYIANGRSNGAQAAREAGYSHKNARKQASKLLRDVGIQARIEKRVKELADKVGLTNEYMLEKLKHGLDLSIPDKADMEALRSQELSLEDMAKIKAVSIDVRAGVACISEANKMLGNYAPEKHAVLVEDDKTGKVTDLINEYEKDF